MSLGDGEPNETYRLTVRFGVSSGEASSAAADACENLKLVSNAQPFASAVAAYAVIVVVMLHPASA